MKRLLALLTLIGLSSLASSAHAPASGCRLGAGHEHIQHVIYIQFDNTHFRRDNPRVPSDLEQMPHLLDFIREQRHAAQQRPHGADLAHRRRHPVVADRPVPRPPRTDGVQQLRAHLDDRRVQFPELVRLLDRSGRGDQHADGAQHDRPGRQQHRRRRGSPYTRAGCDVGAVATANVVLENTGTGPNGDITKVFGNPSPQATEAIASAAAPAGTAARAKAQTDFVGFAVHCAQGSSVCASGQDDLLPQEPGGYAGFKGLFGAQSDQSAAHRSARDRAAERSARQPDRRSVQSSRASPASTACRPRCRWPTWRRCRSTAFPSPMRTSRTLTTSTAWRATSTWPSARGRRAMSTSCKRVRPGVRRVFRAPRLLGHRQEQHAVRVCTSMKATTSSACTRPTATA